MKRVFSALLALAVSATLVFVATSWKHGVAAVHANGVCSVATLNGTYAFTFSGFQFQSKAGAGHRSVPFYGEGLATFDGEGNFSNAFTFSQNSVPYVTSTGSFTGTYTVNPDCTGVGTAAPGSGGDNSAFVIVNGGSEVFSTSISDPDTLNTDLKKQ
jgi:hypothetical protein